MNTECIKCGNQYSPKRAQLGYRTCLTCGEQYSKIEMRRKSMCTAPLYNKSAYQYITPGNDLKSMGRKV